MQVFWAIAFLVTLVLVYVAFVRPRLLVLKATSPAYQRISAFELTLWGRVSQAFAGVKTVALGAISVVTSTLALIPPDDIPGLQSVPWASFLDPQTAVKITAGLAILMVVTHIMGLLRAARVKAP